MATNDVIEIDDEILLDVLQDPMRTRLMRHLGAPKSIRELAAELGVPASHNRWRKLTQPYDRPPLLTPVMAHSHTCVLAA